MKKIIIFMLVILGFGNVVQAQKPPKEDRRSYCVCLARDDKVQMTLRGFITSAPESGRCSDLEGKKKKVSQYVEYRLRECRPVKPAQLTED